MPVSSSNSAKLVSAGYAYPLYEQGWSLFAPAPTLNYRFAYRCRVGKEWGEWTYPIDNYHEAHDKLAFAPAGRHTLAEYYLINWIHAQLYKDFGDAYVNSLKTLDEQALFKKSFAYRAYQRYLVFYSVGEDCEGVQGKIDIEDLERTYVHEINLPEVYGKD
jgi:hypothetical protein